MKLSWMNENRYFVEKLIRFANIYTSIYNRENYYGTTIKISFAQIQVVEYLLENEELQQNMSMIAERLGISPSNFTKLVHKLEAKGLLEKFYTEHNKKNIIICVTDLGRSLYKDYSEYIVNNYFSEIFEITSKIPPEYLMSFAKILEVNFKDCHLSAKEKKATLIPLKK